MADDDHLRVPTDAGFVGDGHRYVLYQRLEVPRSSVRQTLPPAFTNTVAGSDGATAVAVIPYVKVGVTSVHEWPPSIVRIRPVRPKVTSAMSGMAGSTLTAVAYSSEAPVG